MEELTDTCGLRVVRQGVHPCEGDLHESRSGGKIARKTHAAHAAAVRMKIEPFCEGAGQGRFHRQVPVICQAVHLHVKSRIVCHDTDRIVIDMKAGRCLLDDDDILAVSDHPVQRIGGELVAEGFIRDVDVREKGLRLLCCAAE